MLYHKIKMESTSFVDKKKRPVGYMNFGFKSNLHLHSMNYCHRLKVTYTIWFNQLISNQLEVTFSYSHGGHK